MSKKESRLGFDPLAWMSDGGDEENNNNTIIEKKEQDNTSSDSNDLHQQKNVPPITDQDDNTMPSKETLIQESFNLIAPQANELARRFYARLFQNYPEVRPLFSSTDMPSQEKKLLSAIKLVVKNVDNMQSLDEVLHNMGQRHEGYGVKAGHYPAVADTLLSVMAELAGDKWTDEVQQAWSDSLQFIAEKMLAAYGKNTNGEVVMERKESSINLMQQIFSAIENVSSPIMIIDRDFIITYVNHATRTLLEENEAIFAQIYGRFEAKNIIGQCIDIFHKDPSYQRRLLADKNNLPYNTDIHLADLIFNLNVTAIVDEYGEYLGNTLEWRDVTQQRALELNSLRLRAGLDSASNALMLCDDDLHIVYMNTAVVKLLENRKKELQQVFPNFEPANLLGRCIDDFHKDTTHQRALLKDPDRMPYQTDMQLLNIHFNLKAIIVTDQDGKYLGNMVEWKDVTDQKIAETKINELINAASQGELDKRLNTEEFTGFMQRLSGTINNLLEQFIIPIESVSNIMSAVSEGDLTNQIDEDLQGEFLILKEAVNSSIGNLANMVNDILDAAGHIASASNEIAQGNTDLSQRTEEQASSLEETASSMEQLTSTVKQNADNAGQANQLAIQARSQAESGGDVVDRTIKAMVEINSSSKKIEDIISVIDEIAFQTNLLALNAAVEAARAGEQGRGFAVVASEVRSLAQRSAAAAKEIKALIKDSVDKVEEGSKLVNESGHTLSGIIQGVKKVSDIIAEIAASSNEQSAGIEQVNKAILQLDEVTQQNAALVEQSAAAGEALNEQAQALNKMMAFFRMEEDNMDEKFTQVAVTQETPPAPKSKRQGMTKKPSSNKHSSYTHSVEDDDEWEEF